MKFYAYKGCDTCRKARKWLQERGLEFEEIAIRDQPPNVEELKQAAGQLGLKRLFNSSGGDYRQLGLKDRLPAMSDDEALALLAERGNLVKRPFVVGSDFVVTGFKVAEWEALIGE